MKIKLFILFLIVGLFLIPFIFAESQDNLITIKTQPDQVLSIKVLDFISNNTIKFLDVTTDSNGITSFTINIEMKKTLFKFMTIRDGKVVNTEYQTLYLIGKPIYLDLLNKNTNQNIMPSNNSTNNILSNTNDTLLLNNIQNNSNKSGRFKFIGNVILTVSNTFSKIKDYFLIGFGIIIFLIIIFFIFKKFKKLNSNIKIRQGSSNIKVPVSTGSGSYDRRLMDAERKLKEAQEEINKIKNVDRIKEVQRRMEADKAELEKLRKGYR